MDADSLKQAAAAKAVELVKPGMKVGLGTGSTARHFVRLLAERVAGGLNIVGVPTSESDSRRRRGARYPLDDAR